MACLRFSVCCVCRGTGVRWVRKFSARNGFHHNNNGGPACRSPHLGHTPWAILVPTNAGEFIYRRYTHNHATTTTAAWPRRGAAACSFCRSLGFYHAIFSALHQGNRINNKHRSSPRCMVPSLTLLDLRGQQAPSQPPCCAGVCLSVAVALATFSRRPASVHTHSRLLSALDLYYMSHHPNVWPTSKGFILSKNYSNTSTSSSTHTT